MSRTIRRKNAGNPWWVGTTWGYNESGIYGRMKLEGKELKKDLAKYHGDHGYTCWPSGYGPGKWFRKNEQHSHRMKSKTELIKFKKDDEYEVQIHARPYLSYWD